MSTSERRLRDRLKEAGVNAKDTTLALQEFKRRESIRNRVLSEKLKSLTKQVNQLLAQRDRPISDGRSINSGTINGGTGDRIDRLLDIRDEIMEANATLALASKTIRNQADEERSSDSLTALLNLARYMVWILCIGLGLVVPGMVLLVALTIWHNLSMLS